MRAAIKHAALWLFCHGFAPATTVAWLFRVINLKGV